MAQKADGTVYINTAIETDGFTAGAKDVEAAVRRMAASVTDIGEKAKLALQKQVDAFAKANAAYAQQEQKIAAIQAKLKEMQGQKIETSVFKDIGRQIDSDTAKLIRLQKSQDQFIEAGGKVNSAGYKRREIEIEELRASIQLAKEEQAAFLASGEAYEPIDTSGVEEQLVREQEKLRNMNNSLATSYESLKDKVRGYNQESKQTEKAEKRKNAAFGASLKTILKYSLGIRSLFVLFNRLRGALVDGFKNLAQFSGKTNDSISTMKSSLTQLKNSFATAFNPILTAVAPALTQFINMVSRAVTYVGKLIAALTGQKTFIQAKAVQEDYAESLSGTAEAAKEAQKYLSGLDEIQTYEDNKASSSGGGAGGVSPADMFEEVAIDQDILDFADKLRAKFAPVLEWIQDHSDEILKTVLAIGGALLLFKIGKAFYDAVKNVVGMFGAGADSLTGWQKALRITTGLVISIAGITWSYDIGKSFGSGAMGGTEKFFKGLISTALSSFGAGLALSAVAGPAGWVIGITLGAIFSVVAMEIGFEKGYRQTLIDAFYASPVGQELKALDENIVNRREVISDLSAAITDLYSATPPEALTNLEIGRNLLEDIFSFSEEDNHTKQEIDENIARIQLFNSLGLDDIQLEWDETTGYVIANKDAIYENINALEEQIKVEAAQELYKEALKRQYEAELELYGAVMDYKDAAEKVNAIDQELTDTSKKLDKARQRATDTYYNNREEAQAAADEVAKLEAREAELKTALEVASDTLDNASSTLNDARAVYGKSTDAVDTLGGAYTDLISSIGDASKETRTSGTQIGLGLVEGIDSMLGEVERSGVALGNAADAGAKAALGIASPSKVMTSHGENTAKGLENGIKNGTPGVVSAFTNMLNQLLTKMESFTKSCINNLNSMLSQFASTMKSVKVSGSSVSYTKASPPGISRISAEGIPQMPVFDTSQIPYLATGAVIPPNAPFMAMLGDQSNGRNLELPEDLLRKIVREETGGQGADGNLELKVYLSGRQIFEEVMRIADLVKSQSGRSPFEGA